MFKPNFKYTDKMVSDIAKIATIKEDIDNTELIPLYRNKLIEKSFIEATYHSTHIKGNQLNIEQITELVKNPKSPENMEEQEVINYFHAIKYLKKNYKKSLTKEMILAVHSDITKNLIEPDFKGKIRDETVNLDNINNFRNHTIPDSIYVDKCLDDLIKWVNMDKDMCCIIQSGIFHYELLRIHPFVDGNGRVSRFFSAMVAYTKGFDISFFSIWGYYNSNPIAYFNALHSADMTGDLTTWLEYYCEGILISLSKLRDEIYELSATITSCNNIINLSPTEIATLNLLDKYQCIQNKDIQELFGISSQGSHKILKKLVNKDFIKSKGKGRSTKYYLKT